MSGFLGGFVKGLAESGSRQIQEEREKKRQEEVLQKKMMYEIAAEDYKANSAKRRKITDANEAITNMYPDAPIELRTKAAAAWIAGADPKQIMRQMEKEARLNRQQPTQPQGALPGMGAPDQSMGNTTAPPAGANVDTTPADPNDFTDKYNTPLSSDKQQAFEAWRSGLPKNLQSSYDYDLQGAFLGGENPAANGHMKDTWKKPNHPTFSNESQYNSPETPGGSWTGPNHDQYVPAQSGAQRPNTKPEVKPWEVGMGSSGGFFSEAVDPSKNTSLVKPLDDMITSLEKSGASQELVNYARQSRANTLTVPDLEDAGVMMAQSMSWLNKAAEIEGVNYMNADRKTAFVDTAKSVLSRALQEYQPNLATEVQSILSEANSPNANFPVLETRLQGVTGKIRRFVSPTESVALDNNARQQREAQVAPLKNQASELRKAGKMDEALQLEQQAADFITGRGAEPDRAVVQEGAKNTYPLENTDKALKIIQKILDPSLAEGGININDPMAPQRKTKPDVTRASAAILEHARSRIRRGISTKDEITDASELAGLYKDAFDTLGNDGTNTVDPASETNQALGKGNAQSGNDKNYSGWLRLLQNEDFRRDAPMSVREIEQQIIKNSKNKDKALNDIAAAKKQNIKDAPKGGGALPGVPPEATTQTPTSTPYMDKVYESSAPIIQKENEQAKRTAIVADKQKIDQGLAEGKPKRQSVEEYYRKVEDLSNEEYRTYKQTNPFEGDEADLKAYSKAAGTVVSPKKMDALSKLDPEFKKISEDLNISAADIHELAKTKASANDIREQTKSESIRQVAAERKVKMLMDMDEARFAQFVENISDETLKNFFIQTRQRWNKK